MEYDRLGRSGLKLSKLSFGSWVTFSYQLDASLASELMKTAYDAGINFFDNAEVYAGGESEKIMGQVLKKMGWSRDSYCVSSKVFWGGDLPTQRGLSRKHVHDACHAALGRLNVEYLDLFFCHRPDLDTPVEETARAMHDLIQQGKVLYWGTSEWSAQQIQEAYGVCRERGLTPPTMEQPQYNMLHRERVESEYAPLFERYGLGTTIWSPLASGILTGKYADGIPPRSRMTLPDYKWLRERIESPEGAAQIEKARRLETLAKRIGIPLAELAIAWCVKNPNVSTVILGASTVQQLQVNLHSLDHLGDLTDEVMEQVEQILQNKPEPPVRW